MGGNVSQSFNTRRFTLADSNKKFLKLQKIGLNTILGGDRHTFTAWDPIRKIISVQAAGNISTYGGRLQCPSGAQWTSTGTKLTGSNGRKFK